MKVGVARTGEFRPALLDLFACLIGFSAAALVEYAWVGNDVMDRPEPWVLPWVLSAIIAWFAMVFPETQWHEGSRLWIDGFFTVVAFNLLVQCGLIYLFGMTPASWLVIVLGSALSMGMGGLLRRWIPLGRKDDRQGIVLVGPCHFPVAQLDSTLREHIVGALADDGPDSVPAGTRLLGSSTQLGELCETTRAGKIVVSGKPAGATLTQLLQMHYSGIEVEGAAFFCERELQRVAWQESQPSELLFFLNPNTSRAMLAFQAIYKNLIGLGLRVLAAPLLILISLLIVLTGGGSSMEQIECLGYQRTPFQLLRFRVRGSDGNLTGIGKWIVRLHLTNLPLLINVVRGEMGLFGPAPVRTPFANRMLQLLPPYVYRFTVKPGIFGCYQAHLKETGGLPDEIVRLEYDLYYIKQESPSLDLDILMRMLFPRSPVKSVPPANTSDLIGTS